MLVRNSGLISSGSNARSLFLSPNSDPIDFKKTYRAIKSESNHWVRSRKLTLMARRESNRPWLLTRYALEMGPNDRNPEGVRRLVD